MPNTIQKLTPSDSLTAYASLPFVQHRLKIFNAITKRNKLRLSKLDGDITVSLISQDEDELEVVGPKGQLTPHQIATQKLGNKIASKAVVAKVDGQLYDLHRPLEHSCRLEILDFDSKEGKHVFWHSSAHALGETLELLFQGHLTIGPALEHCFYYDADLGERNLSQNDYKSIENALKTVVKDDQRFERIELSKEEALEMFCHNDYKQQLIKQNIADGVVTTAYKCGPLIDLCRGPHLPSTGRIGAFKVIKHSACYWKGDSANKQLQRVYGLSFPNKKQLKIRLKEIALSKERDHRIIGRDQNLFFFNPLSPGSAFWTPYGTKIYNGLLKFLRREYRTRGYKEVISPNIYNMNLWDLSGHAAKYKKNMFCFEVEKQEFAMKPMNCPGHCLIFKQQTVSYRDLPMRLADFGVLHRNELTGALSGLTRVRRFQQDDAHIFCSKDDIAKEVGDCLSFMDHVYGIFGFKFSLVLSTRPDEFIGSLPVWNQAEEALKQALDEFKQPWELNEGDGAFYGPKIDVLLHDALGRSIQCATVQLDFNLPSKNRFDLTFSNKENELETPVIIHRAILGSVERFVSILAEHCGGKWPFWLSPRQVKVLPVSEKFIDFSREVKKKLWEAGIECELDSSNNKLKKKIRNAQLEQFNMMLVVGQKEMESGEFPIRFRELKEFKTKTLEEFVVFLEEIKKSKSNDY